MQKQRHYSDTVYEAEAGLWSNCLSVGDLIVTSGLTARGEDGKTIVGSDAYEQSQVIFQKLKDLMEAADGSIDDIVQMTIFVTDMSQNTKVWKARREFFTGDFPSCALVEVSGLAQPEILVEIQALGMRRCSAN
ncbi:RidA family protein [Rhodococcus koreensis]